MNERVQTTANRQETVDSKSSRANALSATRGNSLAWQRERNDAGALP